MALNFNTIIQIQKKYKRDIRPHQVPTPNLEIQ